MYYELESTAERRVRRNNDIKTLFFQLTSKRAFLLWTLTKSLATIFTFHQM